MTTTHLTQKLSALAAVAARCGWAAFGVVLLAVLSMSCQSNRRRAFVVNKARVTVPSPVPALARRLDVTLEAGREVVVDADDVCVPLSVDVDSWRRALERDGFYAQAQVLRPYPGYFGLRFRRGNVFGDAVLSPGEKECQKVVVRLQLAKVPVDVRWATKYRVPLELLYGEKRPWQYCVRYFEDDPELPFEETQYAWGCEGPLFRRAHR